MRTLALALALAMLVASAAEPQEIVSTAGSPYQVVLADGTILSSHTHQHTATAAALRASAERVIGWQASPVARPDGDEATRANEPAVESAVENLTRRTRCEGY